ncbi:MAG: zinc ribbon domain-containing protein [Planctomycetaceae bacterium]|nr:zinc ribbon domain-containing protein [Planctomycetaceae bacterium]
MEADEKTCPYCAETIKSAAVVCKHCGRDLPSQGDDGPAETPTVDIEKPVEDLKTAGKNLKANFKGCSGCVLIIIIAIAVIGSCRPKSDTPDPAPVTPTAPPLADSAPPATTGAAAVTVPDERSENLRQNQEVFDKLTKLLRERHPEMMERGRLDNLVYPGSTKTRVNLVFYYPSAEAAHPHMENDTTTIVEATLEVMESLGAGDRSQYRVQCDAAEPIGTKDLKIFGNAAFYGEKVEFENAELAALEEKQEEEEAARQRVAMLREIVERAKATGAIKKMDERERTIWVDELDWMRSNRDEKENITNLFKQYFSLAGSHPGFDIRIRSYSNDAILAETGWTGAITIHR